MSLLLLFNGSVQGTNTRDMPDIYLEWSPTTGPRDAPVWERIPLSDIRSIDVNRGRNRELDQFQPGSMTVILDNRDRAYDPQFDTTVKPMKRIPLRSVPDTTEDLFSGFADGCDQNYEMTKEATVTLTATDGFKVWEQATLGSVYAETIQADLPAAWWRLNEGPFATSILDASGNGHNLAVNGSPTFGATSLNEFDTDTAVTITAATQGFQIFNAAALPVTASFTVEFLIRTTTVTQQLVMGVATAAFGTGFEIDVKADGTIFFNVVTASGSSGGSIGVTPVNDGEVHHVICTWTAGGTVSLYIDGTLDGTATNAGTTL